MSKPRVPGPDLCYAATRALERLFVAIGLEGHVGKFEDPWPVDNKYIVIHLAGRHVVG